MKKLIVSCLSFLPAFVINAQQETEAISLDLLKSPTSVAFNLLNVAPSDIERPTDVTSFAASIRNATSNFTSIPSSYAMEFAPGWLSRRDNMTLDKFNSKRFADVFWQSWLVSFGISKQNNNEEESDESDAFTRSGIGTKFSILRPNWTGETKAIYTSIVDLQKLVLQDWRQVLQSREQDNSTLQLNLEHRTSIAGDNTLESAEKKRRVDSLTKEINNLRREIKDSVDVQFKEANDSYNLLTSKASGFKVERQGGFLDFSTGLVLDFPDQRFNNSEISKAGGWLTGGIEGGNRNYSLLAIARYLYQPDRIFADDAGQLKSEDISTLDFGAKGVIKGARGRFNSSLEAIYRCVLNYDIIDPSWRLVLNAEYDIGFNQKLTLAFGRNFTGMVTKEGNLIAALNFIAGFGAKRKLK